MPDRDQKGQADAELVGRDRAPIDAGLRAREHLELALAAADLGAFAWFPSEDRGELDARTVALFGLSPGTQPSLALWLAEVVHPDDRTRFADAVERALDPAGDGTLRIEHRIRRPRDGVERWISALGVTRFEGEPRVAVRITGVCTDITDRKCAEERHAFLLALSDALKPLVDTDEIQQRAVELLGDHLRADRTFYVEVFPDKDRLGTLHGHNRGIDALPQGLRLSDFGASIANDLRRGRTLIVADSEADPHVGPEQREAFAWIGIRSGLGVPLLKGGQLVAVLSLHQRIPRTWSEAEIELIEQVAERTWAAIVRARAEAALAESEAKYRTLFESIDEGFCLIEVLYDEHGNANDLLFRETNHVFERRVGIGLRSKRAYQVMPQLERLWLEMSDRVARTGESVRFQS